MSTVQMSQFGSTLTDRADGKKAFLEITEKYTLPVVLDFEGVVSLGSSFGDEIILRIAPLQKKAVTVNNTNNVMKNSVRRIVEDTGINIIFND